MEDSFSNHELHPLPKRRLYQQVASQVEKLILTELNPGDRLPAERDLARLLGVSRSSLRYALLRLQMLGLIDSCQSSGTVVREVPASTLIPPLADVIAHSRPLIEELMDFRKMVEPSIAAHAARNARQEDIAALEAILARQTSKVRNGDTAIEEDSQFHSAVAKASQNGILPKVVDVVMDLLRETRASSLRRKGLSSRCVSAHRQIIAAIKRRDATAAARAMSRHIGDLERVSRYRGKSKMHQASTNHFPARG
jgi:GntR family transcriptional regulator, transcriptional repressor for pyruvate dehydrogenase complex